MSAAMSARAKATTPYDMWQGTERHGEENLRQMCAEGIQHVRAGRYDAIAFDLFNVSEREVVETYMRERAPDVPFTCKWMVWREWP